MQHTAAHCNTLQHTATPPGLVAVPVPWARGRTLWHHPPSAVVQISKLPHPPKHVYPGYMLTSKIGLFFPIYFFYVFPPKIKTPRIPGGFRPKILRFQQPHARPDPQDSGTDVVFHEASVADF